MSAHEVGWIIRNQRLKVFCSHVGCGDCFRCIFTPCDLCEVRTNGRPVISVVRVPAKTEFHATDKIIMYVDKLVDDSRDSDRKTAGHPVRYAK